MRLLATLLVVCGVADAGEYVTFASGFRLRVDRHVTEGSKVQLYSGDSCTELDASQVRGFEAEEPSPQPPEPTLPRVTPLPAAPAPATPTPAELADAAADRYGLPRALVRGVMAAESALNPLAYSPKGAIGLMQLMPSTAQALGANPHDPAQNVDAGARYLRDLLLRYNGGLWHALAAYNAGPDAVDKHNGVPPYRETVNYIYRVSRDYPGRDPKKNTN